MAILVAQPVAPLLSRSHSDPKPSPSLHHHHAKPKPKPTSPPQLPHLPTPPPHPQPARLATAADACACSLLAGQIHGAAAKLGLSGRHGEFLDTRLLTMYARCGRLDVARHLFDQMPCRTLHTYLALLTALADRGLFNNVLALFYDMLYEQVELESFVLPVALKACAGLGLVGTGRLLHALAIKTGFLSNVYVGNALIDMYGKCGFLDEAIRVLEGMPERDCVTWNSVIAGCAANGLAFEALRFLEWMMRSRDAEPNVVSWSAVIAGFTQNGYDEEAVEALVRMVEAGIEPNARTLASVLPSCGRLGAMGLGKVVHGYVMRRWMASNSFVVNALMDVYCRCGDIASAEKLFSKFSVRNLVSYNTMLVGYCEDGKVDKAKVLFDRMELDGVKKDAVSWNSIISGFVDSEQFDEALRMFRYMTMVKGVDADCYNLGSALIVCTALSCLRYGKEIHSYAIARGLHSNSFVGSALVEMYCRFQDLAAAEVVFGDLAERNTVTWNVLIVGFVRAGEFGRALELLSMMREDGFDSNIYTWNGLISGCMENRQNDLALEMLRRMPSDMVKPDIYTLGMILAVCAKLTSIEQGKQVHAHSMRCGYDSDVYVGAALVDMYCKCGNIGLGILAFHRINQHNLVSYNTILAGYAMHGRGREALALFNRLLDDGIRPDEITFVSVLSLCVHGGVVDEGRFYFDLMLHYDVKPNLRHYTCMVDLLSRAGKLNEAYELIQNMSMKPDNVVWSALLSGCVTHCNVKLGEIAANRLVELEDDNIANYVLLANLYAVAGKQDELTRTRNIIRDKGMHKSPGCSWVEVRDETHVFLASDQSHAQAAEIYALLDILHWQMRKEGEV